MHDAGGAPATLVVVGPDGREEVAARVPPGRPDLVLVDVLARLQLHVQRTGARLELRGASPELRGLLELVGLAGVLGLEPLGQPELREELGVEEVVQAADPSL